jgi:hypothetical protein
MELLRNSRVPQELLSLIKRKKWLVEKEKRIRVLLEPPKAKYFNNV